MRVRLSFASLLAIFVFCGRAVDADPYTIVDNEGFGDAVAAVTVDLPPGWQGNGRVAWNKPCSGNEFYEVVFSATSADGQSGMRIIPGHLFSWNDVAVDGVDPYIAQMAVAQSEAGRNDLRTQFRNSNCHVGQISGTQQLIDTLILAKRPAGAVISKIEPNELLRTFYKTNFAQAQTGGKTSFDAVIVYLTYPGAQGLIEERAFLSWYSFADDPATRLQGLPGFVFQQTFVDPLNIVWAPADRAAAELPVAQAALLGAKSDATWLGKVRDVQAVRNKQRQDDRVAANKAQQDAYRERQEAFDRQNAAFLETIRQ